MEIKNLINFAAQCNTEESARQLFDKLEEAFSLDEGPLKGLVKTNPDYGLENGMAAASFELSRLINNQYATTIKPYICGADLKVHVYLVHFLDGYGFGSRRWNTVDECDITLEPGKWETTDGWLVAITRTAVDLHANLMMSVGVPEASAYSIANESWNKG